MTDEEVQPVCNIQRSLNCTQQIVSLPCANNNNDSIEEEESSVLTSQPKTETDEYPTSQANRSNCTYPSQQTNCSYVMDINTVQQYVVGPNANEEEFKYYQESIVRPQMPINYTNQQFPPPINDAAYAAMVPPTSYTPIQSQMQPPLLPQQKLKPESAYPHPTYAQIPGLDSNYLVQPNFPTAAEQTNCEEACPIPAIPGQTNHQSAVPSLPLQTEYQGEIPGLPAQPSHQSAVPSIPVQEICPTGAPCFTTQSSQQSAVSSLPVQEICPSRAPCFAAQPSQQFAVPNVPQSNYQNLMTEASQQSAPPGFPVQPNYLPGQPSVQSGTSGLPVEHKYQSAMPALPRPPAHQMQHTVTTVAPVLNNFQTGMLGLPGPGQQMQPNAAPGFPVQPNYQTAIPGLPGQPQGQAMQQYTVAGFPVQPYYQPAMPGPSVQQGYQSPAVFPGQQNYPMQFMQPYNHTAIPSMPGQSNFQATIHRNIVAINQQKPNKKSETTPRKRKAKCYKFENKCEYYSAESSSEEEREDTFAEYIEEEVEIRQKSNVTVPKPGENEIEDVRSEMIKKLLNELVVLMSHNKTESKPCQNEGDASKCEAFETADGPSNAKFRVHHETTFKKQPEASETSERWVITSAKRAKEDEFGETKGLTGWQPGAEKITFDEAITEGDLKTQSEIKVEKGNEDEIVVKHLEKVDGEFTKLIGIGQGDSKTSNLIKCDECQNKPDYLECVDSQLHKDAENICASLEEILTKKSSNKSQEMGECKCCHCRAMKGDCATKALEPANNKNSKLSREKKFLELVSILII